MNIFFDVDYTLIAAADNSLRPGTRETFQKLIYDGHKIYIWSGLGPRWEIVKLHKLERFASGVFGKPTFRYMERLQELGVPIVPDFVIDDYPEIVSTFGGIWIKPYYESLLEDDQMTKVYKIISEYSLRGSSTDSQFRAKGSPVIYSIGTE